MNKRRKAKRPVRKKVNRKSSARVTTVKDMAEIFVSAKLVFGLFNALFSQPQEGGGGEGKKQIDNVQDADAEIVSSKIKE